MSTWNTNILSIMWCALKMFNMETASKYNLFIPFNCNHWKSKILISYMIICTRVSRKYFLLSFSLCFFVKLENITVHMWNTIAHMLLTIPCIQWNRHSSQVWNPPSDCYFPQEYYKWTFIIELEYSRWNKEYQ